MHAYAPKAYTHLEAPTLFVVPETWKEAVQDFVRAPEIAQANQSHICLRRLKSGLLPQWESPDLLLPVVDEFLDVHVAAESEAVG